MIRWLSVRASLLLLFATGCFSKPPEPGTAPIDAAPDAAVSACTTWGPWSTPTQVPIPTSGDQLAPWLSPDRLDLWFGADGAKALQHMHRLTPLAPFVLETGTSISGAYLEPFLSSDQQRLWYTELGATDDVFMAKREADGTFGEPIVSVFADPVSFESGPSLTADELTMVLTIGSSGPGAPDRRLHIAERDTNTSTWSPPVEISQITNGHEDCCASISADGLTLFWERNLAELWTATRTERHGLWGAAQRLEALEQGHPSGDPFLSADGTSLLFARDTQTPAFNDLYESDRVCQDPP